MEVNLRDDKVLFFTKLGVMFSNGVPLVRALENMEKESYNDSLKKAVKSICEGLEGKRGEIEKGLIKGPGLLADLMGKHPDLFDDRTVQLIRAGEETGTLDLICKIIPEQILFGELEQCK